MHRGGELIREARLRAGLTQKELSELTGRERSVIARWEQGVISPPLDSLMQIIHACGFDLPMTLLPIDKSADEELREALLETPSERVERLIRARGSRRARAGAEGRIVADRASADFDPYGLLAILQAQRVSFVVIGAFARVVRGTRELTDGIDVTPSIREDNLDRLKTALEGIDARRVDGKRLDVHRLTGPVVELKTNAGELKRVPSQLGRAATTTSAGAPTANHSAEASDPRSPQPTTSPACSAPSTAPKTSNASSASAA